jgi:ankyrin repeat protein
MLNKSECMKCVLRLKPDIANMKNSKGQTAYDIALENGFQFCAELVSGFHVLTIDQG